jgi:ribosomal-protein-serine acetyltransferase
MSNKPLLCIQVNEETQLRLLEERHIEDYFALIERNKAYLYAWIDVEAYEGSLQKLKAFVKQRLLQFVNGEGYHLGIWYQDALVGILDYRLNWKNLTVELGYWLDTELQGKGIVTQACRTMVRHAFSSMSGTHDPSLVWNSRRTSLSSLRTNINKRATPEMCHSYVKVGFFPAVALRDFSMGQRRMHTDDAKIIVEYRGVRERS